MELALILTGSLLAYVCGRLAAHPRFSSLAAGSAYGAAAVASLWWASGADTVESAWLRAAVLALLQTVLLWPLAAWPADTASSSSA